jgi:NADPH:quinone reductase
MKAIELSEYCGIDCLKIVEVEKPRPGANEILLEVRAAGINFAEMELTKGKCKVRKNPPFIMGFEGAGVVAEVGSQVKNPQVGDKITTFVSSGGYAESKRPAGHCRKDRRGATKPIYLGPPPK